MSGGDSRNILASIRYYGDENKKIHLIDPTQIDDFESVESFNFDRPHVIYQTRDEESIAEPIQVFAISSKKNIHLILK